MTCKKIIDLDKEIRKIEDDLKLPSGFISKLMALLPITTVAIRDK